MLDTTRALQTLTLDDLKLNIFIKYMEDGLSHNTSVTLKIQLSHDHNGLQIRSQSLQELDICIKEKQDESQLVEIIKTYKQL